MSRVSVVVMDWTDTAAPSPMTTCPTCTRRVCVRFIPDLLSRLPIVALRERETHRVEEIPDRERDDQAQQQPEPDQVNVSLAARIHRPPPKPLHDEERHPSSVEGGEGKEVEQPDDDAEERRDIEEGFRPGVRRLTEHVHRRDRPAELAQEPPGSQQAAERAEIRDDIATRGERSPPHSAQRFEMPAH